MRPAPSFRKCADSVISIIQLVQDLTMNDQKALPDSHDDHLGRELDAADDIGEAAMTQEIIRFQQQHREGGRDLELSVVAELE
jgi:hypothetical protein